MIDISFFHEHADALFEQLEEAIELADEEGVVDVESSEGVIALELTDRAQFVINKHEASRQIWVSSPKSGATHYSYDEDEDCWVTEDGVSLTDTLAEELHQLAKLEIEL